jgi:hypothetical protein
VVAERHLSFVVGLVAGAELLLGEGGPQVSDQSGRGRPRHAIEKCLVDRPAVDAALRPVDAGDRIHIIDRPAGEAERLGPPVGVAALDPCLPRPGQRAVRRVRLEGADRPLQRLGAAPGVAVRAGREAGISGEGGVERVARGNGSGGRSGNHRPHRSSERQTAHSHALPLPLPWRTAMSANEANGFGRGR